MCRLRDRAFVRLKKELNAEDHAELVAALELRCRPFIQGALWEWGTNVFGIPPNKCRDWVDAETIHLSHVCVFQLLCENCDCETDKPRMKREAPCDAEHRISGWKGEQTLDDFLIAALLNASYTNIYETDKAKRSLGRRAARSANSRKGMLARLADYEGQLMQAIYIAKCRSCRQDVSIDNRCGCATSNLQPNVIIQTRFCQQGNYREVSMHRCNQCDELFFPLGEHSRRCPYCGHMATERKRRVWIPGHVSSSELPRNADDRSPQSFASASRSDEPEPRVRTAEALEAWPVARKQFLARVANNRMLQNPDEKIERLRELFEQFEQALVLAGNPASDDEIVTGRDINEIRNRLGEATRRRAERFLNGFLAKYGLSAKIRL